MTRTICGALVIGFGNELRGDDGVGPEVARRVEALGLPQVRALMLQQLTPEVAEDLSAVERAVFVDASAAALPAPVIIEPLTHQSADTIASHTFDPRSLLSLSRILYAHAPRAWLVMIQAKQFEPDAPLSDQAEHGAAEATRRIIELLGNAEQELN